MQAIRFKLDGVIYSLTRDQVSAGVASEEPQPIQKLAVRVGAQWYPVKQAFGRAVGLGNDKFNSRRAFDLLQRLDFEVHDTDVDGPLPVDVTPGAGSAPVAHVDRVVLLGLAVQLYAGRQDVDAATVLATAAEFGQWIGGTLA